MDVSDTPHTSMARDSRVPAKEVCCRWTLKAPTRGFMELEITLRELESLALVTHGDKDRKNIKRRERDLIINKIISGVVRCYSDCEKIFLVEGPESKPGNSLSDLEE